MHYNPRVKAKLFKDSKSTNKKRSRSTSQEHKNKASLFPGVKLPLKKKSVAKKLFIKTEVSEEKNNFDKENVIVKKNTFNFLKPSFSKKKDWIQYINRERPERIKVEQPDNRKFFKSTVVHSDIQNKYGSFLNL